MAETNPTQPSDLPSAQVEAERADEALRRLAQEHRLHEGEDGVLQTPEGRPDASVVMEYSQRADDLEAARARLAEALKKADEEAAQPSIDTEQAA